MEKPKTPRKETAIGVAMLLKDFTQKTFIKKFREIEDEENHRGVSFPLATVFGDVEELLSYLVGVKVVKQNAHGSYSCMIEL